MRPPKPTDLKRSLAKKRLLKRVQNLVSRGGLLELDGKNGSHLCRKALEEVKSLLKLSQYRTDTDLLILKGNVLQTLNQQRRAAQVYSKVLKIDRKNIRAHIDLGDYWSFRGSVGNAVKHYDEALALLRQLGKMDREPFRPRGSL